jgi:CheY-like chemotaxis protein
MPGRDGIQSSRELRALGSYARVPTVFVSSTSPRALVEQAAEPDHVEFIRKDGQMFVRLAAWLSENLYASP